MPAPPLGSDPAITKTVLDKLLPPLKKTPPEKELKRICKVYNELIENEDDEYLYETFCKTIESNLYLVLKEKPEFYTLDYFQQEYQFREFDLYHL